MDRSERLKLIERIADSLVLKSNYLIKSDLEEFNFGASGWGSLDVMDSKEFVIEKLKAGTDKDIVDLAMHLGIKTEVTIPETDPEFWEKGYFKLFISHLDKNKKYAKELKDTLWVYGISCFVAHDDIGPTHLWQDEIEKALKTCDGLLALLESGFHQSNWTDQEVGFAFGRDLVIVSVRMGQDPYGFIGKFQAITESNTYKLAEKIFKTLLLNPRSGERMTYALMYCFENSGSFRAAKLYIELLEISTFWNTDLINRLNKAHDSNSQISGSFGVEAIIDRIVKNYS